MRIDKLICQLMPDISRSFGVQLISKGCVFVGGKSIDKSYKVSEGQRVSIEIPNVRPLEVEAEEIRLDIRYEDAHVVVVNKPKGMVVHPAPGHGEGTLVNALLAHCEDLSGIGGVARPGIVHRIDKETSGLLIIAKNDFAHQHLSSQLKTRTLSRTYYTIVTGNVKQDSGMISAPIGRNAKDRKKMAVVNGGRSAVTHFEVLARYKGYSLVKCKLETGRTHQIRVHMAHIGHPIAGDKVYGVKSDKSGIDGQALHAARLEFIHPVTQERIVVESELPAYFEEFIGKLRARGDM